MPYWLARLILASLAVAGILYTVSIHYRGLHWTETTSAYLRKAAEACPQISVLLLLVAYSLACDAFPEANRWCILFCIVIPFYALGHSLWSF